MTKQNNSGSKSTEKLFEKLSFFVIYTAVSCWKQHKTILILINENSLTIWIKKECGKGKKRFTAEKWRICCGKLNEILPEDFEVYVIIPGTLFNPWQCVALCLLPHAHRLWNYRERAYKIEMNWNSVERTIWNCWNLNSFFYLVLSGARLLPRYFILICIF